MRCQKVKQSETIYILDINTGYKNMTDEERLQSVIGSFAIEGIELTEENIEMGKDILSGKRTIDECIAELYKKYGIRMAEGIFEIEG